MAKRSRRKSNLPFDRGARARDPYLEGHERDQRRPFAFAESDAISKEKLAPDPLETARNRGVRLADLLAFTWPGSTEPYISANLGHLLQIAATRADHERLLRPHQVFDVLLHQRIGPSMQADSRPRVFLPRIAREYSDATPTKLGQFDFPSETAIEASTSDTIVGPELVAILLRMSMLREKTNNLFLEGGVRHFLAALVLEEIGRVASDAAGLNFFSWRDILARIIEDEIKNYVDVGDSLDSWLPIIDEIRQTSPPRRSETHAFANDRTVDDLLDTGRDASALADLLLLDDLKPPVAVGVFGPWGSGKSTLIRLVKEQVGKRSQGIGKDDPKVVQINFDAWSHADAENLWASLTAELFDQLADAIDGREADGRLKNGLITEIAKRLRKDTETSPDAAGAIELQRNAVDVAKTKLVTLEHEPVAATVAGSIARELIAKATPKLLSEDDRKNKPERVREVQEAEENKKHLDNFLQACGVPKDERNPDKLAPVLSGLFDLPGRSALLFVLLRRSIGRGIAYGLGAVAATLVIGAGGAAWYLGWGRIPEIWTHIVSSLPSLAVLGTLIGTALVAIRTAAPILALAGEFLARKEKRTAELNKERREAAQLLQEEREKLDAMVAEQKKAAEFAAAYSIAAEGRSREGLLRYFIAYSPELVEVRKKLGLLATVRRCFQTLEQIMREKHWATPMEDKPTEREPAGDKPTDLTHVPDIKRIIVYIDDLDRCSEQHVVQVLQAIHLLLAFDLFVVVVAVDARWLHRAVSQVYSGQLAAPHHVAEPEQPAQAAGATVADYLEKIFQLPIWMRPIRSPATVNTFVSGIDKPEEKQPPPAPVPGKIGEKDRQQGVTMTPVAAEPDAALLQTAAQRRATMSEPERKALAAMALLAGKSPRGLKRLVNTYRLMRVMRGPTGIADLEAGAAGETPPLYPYVLFALACEVGLTTETAGLVAEIALRKPPQGGIHPLVVCLFPDEDIEGEKLDGAQARLRACLETEGMRGAVFDAVCAVYVAAAGGDPSAARAAANGPGSPEAPRRRDPAFISRKAGGERFAQAFDEAARFTFRPRNR